MKFRLISNRVIRGTRPKNHGDYWDLQGDGVNTVINLEYGFRDFFGKHNRDAHMAIQSRMMPLRFELGIFFAPTRNELDCICWAIQESEEKVYVHCLSGVDRTGLVIAWYRYKVQGWKIEDCIKEMHAEGMHWFYRFFWTRKLREYARRERNK